MAKSLVIVESPAKAKTINKYLGGEYVVEASIGHIMDLPKNDIGVELERRTFEPTLVVSPGKEKVVAHLKKLAAKSEYVYLAPDPDREGEAIAAHLAMQLLPVMRDKSKLRRVTFNEITQKAVKAAFAHSRDIDENLVDAQQTRRVLDRLVGYQISPLLWDKVRRGLSAGRVQTVALRLIVEREQEINEFKPVEYWNIEAKLKTAKSEEFTAKFVGVDGIAARVSNGVDAEGKEQFLASALPDGKAVDEVLAELERAKWSVRGVEKKERRANPTAPYITSKLQQDASSKLGFNVRRTMGVAQRLYEGVEIGKEGTVGLITYMRTDSTRVSPDAIVEAREFIAKLGKQYLPEKANEFAGKRQAQAQDAHEAIRPTRVDFTPDSIRASLSEEQYKLYKLIWQKFVSSQMTAAVFDQTTVDIAAQARRTYDFRVTGSVQKFDGYLKVWEGGSEDTNPAGADAGAGVGEDCGDERAEVYPAAAALQRGEPGEDAGGARDWKTVDVCIDHQHDPGPRLCEEDRQEVCADGDWHGGDGAAGEELSLHLRSTVHGEAGERAGCGGRRPGKMDRPAEWVLRPL